MTRLPFAIFAVTAAGARYEALLFLVWLASPALLLTWIAFAILFVRRDVFRLGRTLRTLVGIALSTVAVPIGSVAVLLVFPSLHVAQDVSPPTDGGRIVPPVFFPALLAAGVVAPLIAWWVTKGLTQRCSEPLAAPHSSSR